MVHPLLRSLIERHYRLMIFKRYKPECPDSILKSAEELVVRALERVRRELNIDGEEYLGSIQGQIDYIDVIQGNEMRMKMYDDQCGRCKKYQYKDDNYSCKLYDSLLMNCKMFEDCGMSLEERIAKYVEKCSECQNSKLEDDINLICNIKIDMFDCENCKKYISKQN